MDLETTETAFAFPLLKWRSVSELFVPGRGLLVFLIDGEGEGLPSDVEEMVEAMRSNAPSDVRVFVVDAWAEPDFLELFGLRPGGTTVIRRLPDENTFDFLRGGQRYAELIEFCRTVFEESRRRLAS